MFPGEISEVNRALPSCNENENRALTAGAAGEPGFAGRDTGIRWLGRLARLPGRPACPPAGRRPGDAGRRGRETLARTDAAGPPAAGRRPRATARGGARQMQIVTWNMT